MKFTEQFTISSFSLLIELRHGICPVVTKHVRFLLSLRKVEDLLHELGFKICHVTVRFRYVRST